MKNIAFLIIMGLLISISCTKNELSTNEQLEQRNDNHKNWKLAALQGDWTYTTTDGGSGSGSGALEYVYRCTRPLHRLKSMEDVATEDGNPFYNYSRSMTYNSNWMIATEEGVENGENVVRAFNYDANGKWTGITTSINGVVLDDEMTIDPDGQVTSYTHDGVRLEYVWRGNNPRMIKTYVQPSVAMSKAQHSKALGKIGFNKMARSLVKVKILESLSELQEKNKANYRSKSTDEWVLVQIEELEVDHKIVQPFISPANGYPGTTGDGGWLYRSKNYLIKFTDYLINPDGSRGEQIFFAHNHTVAVDDNLPQNVIYSLNFPAGTDDDGNPIHWNETGTIHYDYISGCNENGN